MSELITGLLAGFSSAAAILTGLFAWFGKVFVARMAEAERSRHAQELELLRSALRLENAHRQRISSEKWTLYMEVWGRLQDVKTVGDRLWERASVDQLRCFLSALTEVRVAVNRGRLILQPRHFERLNELLKVFENYQIGKKRLIEIRTDTELQDSFRIAGGDDVQHQIRQNGALRAEYESLLDEIASQFRVELHIDRPEPDQ